MNEMKRIKEVAIEAATESGKYILEHMGKLKEISHKDGVNNLVTDVDRASEKMIVDMIKEEFPSHSILAEEGGEYSGGNDFKWIIDPLDGTVNYAHTFPVFCVSIGVEYDGNIKFGVVFDPTRNEIFTAEAGKGAFLNGEEIKVSKAEKVQEALVATGFAYKTRGRIANIDYFRTMLEKARAVRRAGAAAIDLCYVACGRLDGFWELGLCPWDVAAGQLIIKEAGGAVTMLTKKTFNIHQKEVLATNGKIHEEMRCLLQG